MYIKDLEYEKIKALRANNTDFDAGMTVSVTIKGEFTSWIDNLREGTAEGTLNSFCFAFSAIHRPQVG